MLIYNKSIQIVLKIVLILVPDPIYLHSALQDASEQWLRTGFFWGSISHPPAVRFRGSISRPCRGILQLSFTPLPRNRQTQDSRGECDTTPLNVC